MRTGRNCEQVVDLNGTVCGRWVPGFAMRCTQCGSMVSSFAERVRRGGLLVAGMTVYFETINRGGDVERLATRDLACNRKRRKKPVAA